MWAPCPKLALSLAQSMNKAGFSSPEGLRILSDIWRPLELENGYHSMQLGELSWSTVKRLESSGPVGELADPDVRALLDHWPFPMHSADLSLTKPDNRPELRELRKKFWEY